MKAALLVEPGRLVVDEVPEPVMGAGDVTIQVEGVGLCGSDSSVFSGKWKTPARPWLMGHEAFGTIVAAGERVPQSRVGETVVVEPNVVCSTCPQCLSGLTSACANRQSVGMNRPGALAERLVIPAPFAWAVVGLPAATLVCVEPLTVVEAALRRIDRPPPEAALVVGAGPQGLLMALALMRRGTTVHVSDVNADRAAFAGQLGARPDLADDTFELVVDTVGSPAANEFAVAHSAVGAVVLVLGLDDRPLGVTAQKIVRRQLQVRGSLTYDHPIDFAATIAMLADGQLDPSPIVTHSFPLEDAQQAFEQSPKAPGKTWVRIGQA